MNWIQFCLRRKVTVTMGVLCVFLFGMIAWFQLDQEFMPELEFPQLLIVTSYPNASSQEVENLVTKVIEEAVGTVKNLQRVHSSSKEGVSIVTVEFFWGTNMDLVSLNLREKLDLAKPKLPRECKEPRVERFNPFALPVMTLSLSGRFAEKELLELAKRPVSDLLEKIPGVATVSLTGGLEREIAVEVHQAKLTAYGLSITDVGDSISEANWIYPAGNVKQGAFDYVVRVMGAFNKPQDLESIAIKLDRVHASSSLDPKEMKQLKSQGKNSREFVSHLVPLGAIADVIDQTSERSSFSRYNSRPNVSLAVLKQADANIVRVAQGIKSKLENIRKKLPPGMVLELVYDQSVFIVAGIRGMIRDGIVGGVLAFCVLFIFLGNWRDATVVCLSIPVSVFATFFMMNVQGMTLNTVTLAGLAIGIGMLVDGAIVVQENIVRYCNLKGTSERSVIEGATEMFSPVASSICTTIAVFLPFIFVSGIMGQVFAGLSWTVVFSQVASLIVAFTVIPLLAYLMKQSDDCPKVISLWREKLKSFGERGIGFYHFLLDRALEMPNRVLGGALALCLLSIVLLMSIPKALFPEVETSQVFVRLDMPIGTALDVTHQITKKIEEQILKYPEIENVATAVGSVSQSGLQTLGNHQSQVTFDIKKNSSMDSQEVIQSIESMLEQIYLAGGQVSFFQAGGAFDFLGAGKSAPLVIEIKGNDFEILESVSENLLKKMESVEGLYNLRSSVGKKAKELQLYVDRDKLSKLGVSVIDLSKSVLTAIRGKVVSQFREKGKEIDIRLRLREKDRENLRAVEQLYVHSVALDEDIPLEAVVDIQEGHGPSEILRYDQERTVLVQSDFKGRSLDAISKDILKIMEEIKQPSVRLELTGQARKMSESFQSLKWILVLAILFVFMIMASLFESLWQPFLVLLTIPLALIGMVLGLLIFGHEFSAISGMGLILLSGIVVNNGIVLIDRVNSERKNHLSLKESLKKGCLTRLRPILMTAFSTILGMFPLALGIGQGAASQAPMAVVIVCGLLVSTLLTLLILPCLFLVVDRFLSKFSHA